jgi:hypothetical protein
MPRLPHQRAKASAPQALKGTAQTETKALYCAEAAAKQRVVLFEYGQTQHVVGAVLHQGENSPYYDKQEQETATFNTTMPIVWLKYSDMVVSPGLQTPGPSDFAAAGC